MSLHDASTPALLYELSERAIRLMRNRRSGKRYRAALRAYTRCVDMLTERLAR